MAGEKIAGRMKVQVHLDSKGIYADLRNTIKRLEATTKGIQIPVSIDHKGLTKAARQLDALERSLERIKDAVNVRVNVDNSALGQMDGQSGTVRTVAELDPASIQRIRDELRAQRLSSPVMLDPELNHSRLAVAMAELRSIGRTTIQVGVNYDQSAFKRITSGLAGLNTSFAVLGNLRDLAASADDVAMSLGKAATAAMAIGAATAGAVGFSAILLQDMGGVARAAGLMAPALAGAFFILKKIFQGLRNEVKGTFDNFAISMNQAVDKGFNASQVRQKFQEMGDIMAVTMAGPMRRVGQAAGDMAAHFARMVSHPHAQGQMVEFVENLAAGLRAARPAAGLLASGLIDLGQAGSRYFPAMGKALHELTYEFTMWTTQITRSGEFDAWLQSAWTNVKALADIGLSAISMVNALGDAARKAGIGGLPELANGLHWVAVALHDPAWQRSLVEYFSGFEAFATNSAQGFQELAVAIQFFGDTFLELSGIAGTSFGSILSIFSDLMNHPAVTGGLVDLFQGFADGLHGIQEATGPIGGIIGSILTLFGALAKSVMEVAAAFAVEFGPAIEDIAGAFTAIIPEIDKFASKIFATIGPAVRGAASAIRQFAEENPKLAAGIALAVAAVGPFLIALGGIIRVGSTVVGAISTVASVLGKIKAPPGLAGVGGVFSRLAGAAIRLAGPIGVVIGVFAALYSKSEPLRKELGELLNSIINLGKSIWDSIQPGVKALGNLWDAISPVITGLMDLKAELAGSALALLFNAIGTAIQTIADIINGDWAGAMETLKNGWKDSEEIIQGVLDMLGDLGGKFMEWLGQVGSDLYEGFKGWIEDSLNGLGEWFQGILDWFGEKGSEFFDSVASWVKDIVAGIEGWYEDTRAGFEGWLEDIKNWFAEKEQWIVDQVAQWVEGVAEGIRRWYEDTRAGFEGWLEDIKNWFSEKENWVIDEVAKWVNGVIAGIATWWGSTQIALEGWWLGIWGWFLGIPGRLWNSVVTWVTSIVNGISTWWGGTLGALEGWWNGIWGWFLGIPGRIAASIAAWVSGLVTGILSWWGGTLGALEGWWGGIVGWFHGIPGRIAAAVMAWVSGIVRGISTWWGGTLGALEGWWNGVIGWLHGLPGRVIAGAIAIGDGIIQGILTGIGAGVGSIIGKMEALARDALGAAKRVLGINSPSKEFKKIGRWVSEGMAIGIESQAEKAVTQVEKMSDRMMAVGRRRMTGLREAFTPDIPNTPIDRINTVRNAADNSRQAGGAQHFHVHMEGNYDEQRATRRGAETLAAQLNKYLPAY